MTHPVAEVRQLQEQAKSRWSAIVREAIINALRFSEKGRYHADDLEPLGIPEQHRNIIGSQTARLVNQGYMVEVGRRKSAIPTRKCAKSSVYELTPLGRRRLAGGSTGVQTPQGSGGESMPRSSASASPGESADQELLAPPDSAPVPLFPDPKPTPLSPVTDPEAA